MKRFKSIQKLKKNSKDSKVNIEILAHGFLFLVFSSLKTKN